VPTRSITTSKTTLEQVITDQPEKVDKIEILDNLDSSDHHMVRWTTLLGLNQVEYRERIKDYNKADFDVIRNKIAQVDWNLTLVGDANQSWTEFKAILQDAVEDFVPDREQKFKKYKKAIWMTHKEVIKVRKKTNLFKRYRDINNPKYIEAARLAKIEVRRAKGNFEKKTCR